MYVEKELYFFTRCLKIFLNIVQTGFNFIIQKITVSIIQFQILFFNRLSALELNK